MALKLPRCPELIVAILAVLKAGAGYLPIDPALPADRVGLLVADAAPVLMLDHLPDVSTQPDTNPTVPLGPSNTAYVIYTSGSTGTAPPPASPSPWPPTSPAPCAPTPPPA